MSLPIIQIKHVTATYPEKTALKNVSLTVYDDDYLGIIGPNGGGKTTLLKIILGLLKPAEGSIQFFKNGRPANHIRMGYLPQYTDIDRHFPISVHDVVLSGLKKKRFSRYNKSQNEQVRQTIEQMELADLQHEAIGTLSGNACYWHVPSCRNPTCLSSTSPILTSINAFKSRCMRCLTTSTSSAPSSW